MEIKILMMQSTKHIPNFIIQRYYATQVSNSVAVIKLPKYVQLFEEKIRERDAKRRLLVRQKIFKRGNPDVPIITSKKKEYDFFLGQVYNSHFPVPLISRYWMKQKSAGETFTIKPWDSNPSLPLNFFSEEFKAHYICEFSQMNLETILLDGIKAMGYQYPTPVQALVIPKILTHNHILSVAETGCGKTMAYLIPIMQNLLKCKDKLERFPNTPLALIVTPGRELADQIAHAAYQLGMACGISVKAVISGGTKHEHLIPRETSPIDILVGTFGTMRLTSMTACFKLSHLQHLVLDEADTLLDDSFIEEMNRFLRCIMIQEKPNTIGVKPVGTQLILSSCTMPKDASTVFPDIDVESTYMAVRSPYHHRVLPHVSQKFIRVSNDNRAGVLLELVKTDFKKKEPVIIFCNNVPSCDWLSYFLLNNDVPNVKFHANLKPWRRGEHFRRFQSGEANILCCTDLASRGLDTQRAKHVINFDFPNSVSDYILRIGRVGRVGSNQGHVTNLVVSKSGAYTVQEIEMAVRSTTKIQNVDANIKQKLNKLYLSY